MQITLNGIEKSGSGIITSKPLEKKVCPEIKTGLGMMSHPRCGSFG